MLVTFSSSTSGQLMMFAPTARQMLEIIGKECAAKGVIMSDQLPAAIDRLRAAVAAARGPAASPPARSTDDEGDDENKEETPVGLGQRAYPLIELLEWTRQEEGFVLWEAAKDF